MQIVKVKPGKVFPEFVLDEENKMLTVEGIEIDLEAEVKDSQNTISITMGVDGSFIQGLEGKGGYVADVIIPPRKYLFEEVVQEEDPEEEDENEGKKTQNFIKTPIPLDLETVIIRLWPVNNKENG
jgi:hypothetical protein